MPDSVRRMVLVVEDDAGIRELLHLHLDLVGFSIDEVGDGRSISPTSSPTGACRPAAHRAQGAASAQSARHDSPHLPRRCDSARAAGCRSESGVTRRRIASRCVQGALAWRCWEGRGGARGDSAAPLLLHVSLQNWLDRAKPQERNRKPVFQNEARSGYNLNKSA
jgi:hypothetical protein